tara:strand:+ start:717 stop:980 length:264 start_codon:yes stop_codon:yes gene_type:complete
MASVFKKKLNSKFVKIKAPVMMIDTGKNMKEPVWMEKDFFPRLLDTIKEYKIKLETIQFTHGNVKIGFKDYKHATKFRLIYEAKEYK